MWPIQSWTSCCINGLQLPNMNPNGATPLRCSTVNLTPHINLQKVDLDTRICFPKTASKLTHQDMCQVQAHEPILMSWNKNLPGSSTYAHLCVMTHCLPYSGQYIFVDQEPIRRSNYHWTIKKWDAIPYNHGTPICEGIHQDNQDHIRNTY